MKTGIPGLDALLGGGLHPHSATLVSGPPGSGKTTLGLQFIHAGISQFQESGVIITFEEFPETIYRDAHNFGWDLKRYEEHGKLKVIFTSPAILKSELERERGMLDSIVQEIEAKRIVVDPITHFRQLTFDPKELREIYNSLVNGMKRLGLTSILTCEIPKVFGALASGEGGIAFIVDNILLLKFVEIESELQQAVVALKVRGSDHAKDIRRYRVDSRGFEIETKFEDREGLLSGTPRRVVTEATLVEKGLIRGK